MRAGPNFNNVAITGGELTFVGGNINNAPPLKGLDLMLSQCTPGALLNSKERSDPPRCADETRTAILNSLLRWISSNIASNVASIAWLHGPAGGGKTAIAQTLGEQCQKKGLLAATFFFSRTDSEDRSDGDRVISTIAAELIRLIPELKPLVIKAIDDDPFLLSKVMEEQLYELMVKPLRTLAQARGKELGPRLVVIDALDECNDMDAQVDLIKTIANAVPQLAFPFCFLIVSRPESHIVDAFAREPLQSTTTLRLDLSKDTSADADIQLFLELGFEDILSHHRHRRLLPSPWPPVGVIPALVKQSSRQFIYPSTVIKYVRDPKHHPFRRLQDILGLSPSSSKGRPFAGLDSLYTFIFSRVENDNIEVITRFFSLLLVIKSTQNPDRVNLRPAATQLEEFLELDSGDLYFLLDPFLSLLSMPEDPSHDIEIFHISLLDFLLDTNRSFDIRRRGFNISLPLGHTVAAIYWWRRLPDPDRPQGTRITSHFHFIQHCSLVGRLSETLYQCITCAELPRPMEPLQKLWYMWRILCNMLLTRQV
ncbi:hypothetical protein CPB83DRAFT_859173 [Crepidotus variabilis]|uniref:Nephrocystin 3-like N-terminal domain-containing protein n=1 Tax=Crepidotus variabilis TaxID=179855 RepID=A0A9P6JMF5_9AGAR|nr:hypothetical protein CPB83DRAFT_859173 [Crepidotus variabilis]